MLDIPTDPSPASRGRLCQPDANEQKIQGLVSLLFISHEHSQQIQQMP